MIYKYSLDTNDVAEICGYPKDKENSIFNEGRTVYYAFADNTNLSYFNLNSPKDLKTISYLNRIHSFIISNKMLVVLCFDGVYYFRDLSSGNEFELKSTFKINDVLNFKYNKNQTFTEINKNGLVHNFDLSFHNFEKNHTNLQEVSTVYKDKSLEIVGNYNNLLTLKKDVSEKKLKGHVGGISGIDVSKKHKIIVTASYDHTIKIWDFQGALKDSIVFKNDGILNLKLIPDKQKLIVTCKNSKTYLWNLKTKRYKSFIGHNNMVDAIDISKKSDVFVTGGRDSLVMIWNYNKSPSLLKKIREHKGWVTNIKISPDSKHFLSSSTDGNIILWDIEGNLIKKFLGHNDEVWNICWLSDNTFISNSRNNIFCIWNINGEIINLFKGNSSHVAKIISDSDRNELFVYFLNGEKRMYHL